MSLRLPGFEEWLFLQSERLDGTGRLSRLWLATLPSGVDFKKWLQERRSSGVFSHEINEAQSEFDSVLRELKRGNLRGHFQSPSVTRR